MEVQLTARLLGQASFTGVVGQRLTWGRRSQGAPLPAVVLHLIDGVPDYHSVGPSGLVESRVQADCYGKTYAEAKAAANALKAVTSGQRFAQGVVRFDAIFVADERDDTFDEAGTALYRVTVDLLVHHALLA